MSTKITSAAATFAAVALGAAVVLASSGAFANTKGPSGPSNPSRPPNAGGTAGQKPSHPFYDPLRNRHSHYKQSCYWLPTISNGSVSGLEQKCNLDYK